YARRGRPARLLAKRDILVVEDHCGPPGKPLDALTQEVFVIRLVNIASCPRQHSAETFLPGHVPRIPASVLDQRPQESVKPLCVVGMSYVPAWAIEPPQQGIIDHRREVAPGWHAILAVNESLGLAYDRAGVQSHGWMAWYLKHPGASP